MSKTNDPMRVKAQRIINGEYVDVPLQQIHLATGINLHRNETHHQTFKAQVNKLRNKLESLEPKGIKFKVNREDTNFVQFVRERETFDVDDLIGAFDNVVLSTADTAAEMPDDDLPF